MMSLDQLFILVLGPVAIWLAQDARPRRRALGSVVGLLGQPFFLYATFAAAQWGMFVVAVLHTLAWGRGVWEWRRAR